MSWLIFIAISVVADSFRLFNDNYISDVYFKGRGAASQKIFYVFFHLIIAIAILLFFKFNPFSIPISTPIILIISGIFSSCAGIFYFKTLEIDNSVNLSIFLQLTSIFYLIFAFIFFNQTISPLQLVAFFIIISASFLIVLRTRKHSRKISLRALLFTILNILIWVIANLIFVSQGNVELNIIIKYAFVLIGKSIGNAIILIIYKKWINRFRYVYQKSQKKVLRPLFVSAFLEVIYGLTYRVAIVIAPSIALASVISDSTKPILIFFLGLLLTLIWPKFGREKLDRKTVLTHLTATILVAAGIILLQFSNV